MSRGRFTLVALGALAASVLLLGRWLSTLVVEQAWHAAMGAGPLWRVKLLSTLALKGGAWLAGTAFAFANLWAVRRTIRSVAVPTRVADLEFIEMVPERQLFNVTLLAAAAVGVVLTLPLDDWTLLAAVWQGQPFREYEGFFQRDLGFYVHWLPFEGALYTWALVALVMTTALVIVLYALTRSLRFEGRQLVARTHVRRHLTALGTLVLVLLSWSYRLDAYELLLWGSGFDGLFTPVDHRFTTRIDLGLAVATFAAALIVLRTGWIGQVRAAFITVTLVLLGTLVLRQAGPAIARDRLAPDRLADYEATRALFTRRAYAVDAIMPVEPDPAAVPARPGAIAVWDAGSMRSLRLAGEVPAVIAAEPVWQAGDTGPEALIVTRTSAATPVWDVRLLSGTTTAERGVPLVSRHPALRGIALPEPLVAPGIAGHRLVRVDAPLGEPSGRAPTPGPPFADRRAPAVRLDRLGVRLALAWATRDAALLATPEEPDAAVVMHRDLRDRVARVVPALVQGSAVAPLMHGSTLLWAIDLYSASASYPLSVRLAVGGAARSYFRHAGTALVDAQTGAVRLVPADEADAIARPWFALVPALVVTAESLPAVLRARLPIPSDGAYASLRALSRVGSRTTGGAARFVPDSLPGPEPFPVAQGADGAIGWSVPLVDGSDQLQGVFEARGGADRRARWHAMAVPTPRWSALAGRLGRVFDSVTTAVGGEQDGPLVAGVLRVLALDGRPWLVRPAYADEGGSPRLVAIASATDTSAHAARTLDALLGAPSTPEASAGRAPASSAADAVRFYESAREAMRRGDWMRFGAAMDSLGRVLERRP